MIQANKDRTIKHCPQVIFSSGRHDTQHDDIEHNDTHHNDISHNDTEYNGIKHHKTQHDNKHNGT